MTDEEQLEAAIVEMTQRIDELIEADRESACREIAENLIHAALQIRQLQSAAVIEAVLR